MSYKLLRNLLVVSVVCLCITGLSADVVNLSVATPIPEFSKAGYAGDLPVMHKPGEPMLPFYPVWILLPQGEKYLGVEVLAGEITKEILAVELPLFGKQVPISENEQRGAKRAVDSSFSGIYPDVSYRVLGVHRKTGYDLLLINLYPYRYDQKSNRLYWHKNFELSVSTEFSAEYAEEQNRLLVVSDRAQEDIQRLVTNPELIGSYRKSPVNREHRLPDPSDPYSMIVITDNQRSGYLERYVDWRNATGLETKIFKLEDIYSEYSGRDRQEQIRNFVIDAFAAYSQTDLPLEYVLIGGDDEVVPVRGLYCFVEGLWNDYEDYSIPSDVYYSNLDGDWDANGNGIFGEIEDEIDWFAEVAIGRIPAQTEGQFNNFIDKTIHYSDNPAYSNDIAVLIGQNLDAVTWGGPYMDEIAEMLPSEYKVSKFYEVDGTYGNSSIREAIRDGLGILNHLGHSNQNTTFGVTGSVIPQLTNREFGLAYSQGCYTSAFDYASSQEAGAIAQRLVNAEGGFFGFIGNTRYGWYWPESTEGASQLYNLAFFEGLTAENIREIGRANKFSKDILVSRAIENNFEHHLWQNGFMRWVFFNLILFGDPSLELHAATNHYPYLEPISVRVDDTLGDNDGIANPGERIKLWIELGNRELWHGAEEIMGVVSFSSSEIEVISAISNYPSLNTGETALNLTPFIVDLPMELSHGELYFTFSVQAEGYQDKVFSKEYRLSFPVSLSHQHWPWVSAVPVTASPIILQDRDGESSIIVTDALSNTHFLNGRADMINDSVQLNGNMLRSAAMGDLNGDGDNEIVLNNRAGKVYAFNRFGDELFAFETNAQFLLTPVLADVTGDGSLEIISFSADRKLFILDSSGELMPGYPKQISNSLLVEPAAADITTDGRSEIIMAFSSGLIDVVNFEGESISGFPVDLAINVNISPTVSESRAIVTATTDNRLIVIGSEGNLLLDFQVEGRVISEAVLADLTGNGLPEIAFVTNNGRVYVITMEGESLPGFPLETGDSFSQPPLLVDLDNSGYPDVIAVSSSGKLYGFNLEGESLAMLPTSFGMPPTSPLFIADIDADGDFDIGMGTSQGISFIDYKLPAGVKTPWSVYRGNYQRTGYIGDNTLLPVDKDRIEQPVVTSLERNYPNPFNISTTISYNLAEEGELQISVYNLRGRKIKDLFRGIAPNGKGSIVWNGRNENGDIVASGVYFVRLTTDKEKLARKIMLLK